MARRTRAEVKAELVRKFEEELDAVLDWSEADARPNLRQIEEVVLECRREVGRAVAEALLERQDAAQAAPRVVCPECGEEMRDKGQKERVIDTMVGDLGISRSYQYCPRCRRGFFPPR